MSTTVQIEQELHVLAGVYTSGTTEAIAMLEIPGSDSWDDVRTWHVNRDTFHYTLHTAPREFLRIRLDSVAQEVVDWGWPLSVQVVEVDEDGNPTDVVLSEQ